MRLHLTRPQFPQRRQLTPRHPLPPVTLVPGRRVLLLLLLLLLLSPPVARLTSPHNECHANEALGTRKVCCDERLRDELRDVM